MLKTALYFSIILLCIYFVISLLAFWMQERLIFYPDKLPAVYRFQFKDSFEEISFKPEKDAVVHSLLFHSENPKGLVIYFHGNAGSLEGWGHVAPDFTKNGYDALVVDYRGYGKSSGRLSEKALLLDAQYIYDAMKQRYDEKNMIVYGRSLGTGIATFLAMENSPSMLVLETPFYNFLKLVNYHFSWLPNRLILRYRFQTNEWLQKVNCPVIIFHGTEDAIIPYNHSEMLVKETGKITEFITIEGGNHNNLSSFEAYQRELGKMLE